MSKSGKNLEEEVKRTIAGLLEQLDTPGEIRPDVRLDDLGLDSLAGVEFVCQIEDSLNITIPDDKNPFVDDSKKRMRTVSEVVDFLKKLCD